MKPVSRRFCCFVRHGLQAVVQAERQAAHVRVRSDTHRWRCCSGAVYVTLSVFRSEATELADDGLERIVHWLAGGLPRVLDVVGEARDRGLCLTAGVGGKRLLMQYLSGGGLPFWICVFPLIFLLFVLMDRSRFRVGVWVSLALSLSICLCLSPPFTCTPGTAVTCTPHHVHHIPPLLCSRGTCLRIFCCIYYLILLLILLCTAF